MVVFIYQSVNFANSLITMSYTIGRVQFHLCRSPTPTHNQAPYPPQTQAHETIKPVLALNQPIN